MKSMLWLLLLTASPISGYAEALHVDRIDIVDYGTYTARPKNFITAPDTAAGRWKKLGNIQHSATTQTIPAQVGAQFGFSYIVAGEPQGTDVPLHIVIIFPSPGLHNPTQPGPKARDEYDRIVQVGDEQYTGYSFDHNWELVPGVWTFQLWYDGHMEAEQKFTVVNQ